MKFPIFLILGVLLLSIPAAAGTDRIRLDVYHRDYSGIRYRSGPVSHTSGSVRSGLIFKSGNIGEPLTNPDPTARNPEKLTACMYDAKGVLVYEREGKVCAYKYVAPFKSRVEKRRLEWLKRQAALK